MSYKMRKSIADRIVEIVKSDSKISSSSSSSSSSSLHLLLKNLPSIFEIRKTEKDPELHLPVIKTRNVFEENGATLIKQIVNAKYDNRLISSSAVIKEKNSRGPVIVFKLNPKAFIEDTLSDLQYPRNGEELNNEEKNDNLPQNTSTNRRRKYIIEFSSLNIAKPFHVGHLRTTIIGNFLANLFKYQGNDIIKMNYLGDWGTQFGLLQVGLQMTSEIDEEAIKTNPIQNLYKAYVIANQAAKNDPQVAEKARQIFARLEMTEAPDEIKGWEKIREYTVNELRGIYDRIGVDFDEYAWESQYRQNQIQDVVSKLNGNNLLINDDDGKKIIKVENQRVPLIKSDGTTLYLLRDIAALLDRFERYKFDKIFYVVDNAQTDHFKALFHIADRLEPTLRDKTVHVKYGRIKGMSTRRGNAVFLSDILDEARDIMMQKQLQSPTTKIDLKNLDTNVADILGVSAVIVNDLKQRRQRDYDFNWDKALQVNGDTGIKLQYTHCRLCSLLENISIQPANTANSDLLKEIEAIDLLIEIARFPEIIQKAEESLEACVLVNYLFALSNATSKALKCLNVKKEKSLEIQQQRILLFNSAKMVLHRGMSILGLKPLSKM